MNRIKKLFLKLNEKEKKAFIAYFVAGDPNISSTLINMHLMVSKGVDLLELGVAFSDPMAEGQTIQRAHERALAKGITLKKTLNLVKEFRRKDQLTPIVLMGYLNPFEAMGADNFFKEAHSSGVDGILIVDMPPQESKYFTKISKKFDIDIIRLIAPTTSSTRIEEICKGASGYIYYISLKGITGADTLKVREVKKRIKILSRATDLPIVIGFGIKEGSMVRSVKNLADGIVVGSALVDIISKERVNMNTKLTQKVEELAEALN